MSRIYPDAGPVVRRGAVVNAHSSNGFGDMCKARAMQLKSFGGVARSIVWPQEARRWEVLPPHTGRLMNTLWKSGSSAISGRQLLFPTVTDLRVEKTPR